MNETTKNIKKLLNDSDLENISGGPEERTVLGLASAADCRKCKNCGNLIENNGYDFCPVCHEKLS